MPKIMVNGKTYNNVDEIPSDARDAYLKALELLHDSDGNGIPDFLEGSPLKTGDQNPIKINMTSDARIVVGDKVFASPEELPPDVRLKYDQAIAKLGPLMSDQDGNGIPDFLEEKTGQTPSPMESSSIPASIPDMTSQEPPSSVIQEESTSPAAIVFVLLMVLFLLGAVGLGAYILLNFLK